MTLEEFWQKWGSFCTFKLGSGVLPNQRGTPMRKLLPTKGIGSNGVCEALCIDWIRRKKLASKSGEFKDSLASSKRDPSGVKISKDRPEKLPKASPTGRRSDFKRMQKKVKKRVLPVQKVFDEMAEASKNTKETAQAFRFRTIEEVKKQFPLYVGLSVRLVGKKDVLWLGNKSEKTGREIFRSILKAITTDQETVSRLDPWSPCFVVDLAGWGHGGHAVAFEVNGSRIHFIDPNAGEFLFLPGGDEPFSRFCDDWWAVYCEVFGNRFRRWHLYQYYPDPK